MLAIRGAWGAGLALLLAAPLHGTAAENHIDLNGAWTFSIHGRGIKTVQVPSTYPPVGGSTLERQFVAEPPAGLTRPLLRFDGIAITAEVFLNQTSLGKYGPYAPFTIDVSESLRAGSNHLRVELSDLGGFAPWGRNWVTAFPRMTGIIRDVYLDWKPPVSIENVRLDYDLNDTYDRADCRLNVWIVNTTETESKGRLTGSLDREGVSQRFDAVIHAPPGNSLHKIPFQAGPIDLWSPESPQLYDLSVSYESESGVVDRFAALTGFKKFVAYGRDLFLNGKKYFLKGVFRHDIYGDQGHTLTRQQMETEIADIKSLGANFLRLGHYPQHPYISELAARYGLLTSGEPPIFGLSQEDADVVEAAKLSLGSLIRRDWNNPAAAVWIISNEVGTNLNYMKAMAGFVRSLDPSRLVTVVDNQAWTSDNAPWGRFRDAGIDFISHNAYGSGLNGAYAKLAEILPDDMPYVISEWGGTTGYANTLREGLYFLQHSNLKLDDGPRIAGILYWEYQDIPMQRWTAEGVLHWSLVDQFRNPYETYYALRKLYTGKNERRPRGRLLPNPMPVQLARQRHDWEPHPGYETLNLSGVVNSATAVKELKAVSPLVFPGELLTGEVVVGGLPFRLENELIALTPKEPKVTIAVDKAAAEIEFLGQVVFNSLAVSPTTVTPELPFLGESFPHIENPPPYKGYPQAGDFGELAAEYLIEYVDGEVEPVQLLNGIHLCDYRLFYGMSPIDAIAVDTERVLRYRGDGGAKTYQMRLLSYHPKRPDATIRSITFRLKDDQYIPLLAGVTIQTYDPVDSAAAKGPEEAQR